VFNKNYLKEKKERDTLPFGKPGTPAKAIYDEQQKQHLQLSNGITTVEVATTTKSKRR
jgi:hypothetical protein